MTKFPKKDKKLYLLRKKKPFCGLHKGLFLIFAHDLVSQVDRFEALCYLEFGNVGVFKKQQVIIAASTLVMRGTLFHKVALGILQPPISEWCSVPRFFCI